MNNNYKINLFTGINLAIFIAVLGYSIYSLFCYGFNLNGHPFYGIPRMEPGFADLRQLTYSSGCSASVDELINNLSNCDPYKRLFNYTPVSLALLRALNVNSESTRIIGFMMGILAIFITIFIFLNCTQSKLNIKLISSSLFMGSFPFQLALERGNYDLLIMILFVVFALLVNFSKQTSGISRLTAIGTAASSSFLLSALKIFPMFGITLWYILCQKNRKNPMGYLWIVFPTILGVAIQSTYILSILSNTPKPLSGSGFGVLSLYQGTRYFPTVLTLKIAIALTVFYMCLKLFPFGKSIKLYESKHQDIFYLSFLIVLPVYIISNSFDYRLIFLVFIVPSIFNLQSFQGSNRLLKLITAFLTVGIFFVAYEQYAPGRLGVLLDLLSDALIQPALFIIFTFLVFKDKLHSMITDFQRLILS